MIYSVKKSAYIDCDLQDGNKVIYHFVGFRSGTTLALDIQDTMLMMYIKMFWGKHIAIYIRVLDDVNSCVLILDMIQVCSGE